MTGALINLHFTAYANDKFLQKQWYSPHCVTPFSLPFQAMSLTSFSLETQLLECFIPININIHLRSKIAFFNIFQSRKATVQRYLVYEFSIIAI